MMRAGFILLFASLRAVAAPFAGVCDGVTDDTPALSAQIQQAAYSRDRLIEFPAAICAFYSPPTQLSNGVSLIGQSKSTTVLMRKYSGSFISIRGQGSRVENLTLFADAGTSGGTGIYAVSDEADGPGGNHTIAHVWVTGQGTWVYSVFLDGKNKTTPPRGIRTVTMYDVSLFNATAFSLNCWNCVGLEWFGGGAYQGFGSTQALAVGGEYAANNYINAMVDRAASTFWPGAMRN